MFKLVERPDSQTVMAQLPKWFDNYYFYHPPALGYPPAKLLRENRAVNQTYRRYWVTGSSPVPSSRSTSGNRRKGLDLLGKVAK